MEKINNKINEYLLLLKQFFTKDKKITFIVTICTALLVHFQLYALVLTGPDTLINSMYHYAGGESSLGRFGLYFVQLIKGNVVSPFLATLISCILLGLIVVLINDILKIKNKFFQILIGIIFAVAPNFSATLTFFYCSDAYMIGMFLATLSVFLVRKFEKSKWIILISGFCIGLSMGMYQTYLSVTMVLCIATLLVDLLQKKNIKEIGGIALKYIVMGIIGIILYYTFSQVILFLRNMEMSSYSGGNEIGLSTLLYLPELLPQAYQSFFKYFFTDAMLPNSIWYTNLLYIVLFSTIIISLAYIIIKNKIYKEKINLVLILLLLIVAPICFGIIEIMVPDVNIHILMACSMILVFPIFFKIIELISKGNVLNITKVIIIICTVIIAWNYTWQNNASYIVMKSQEQQLENVMNRVVTRIESTEGYNVNMPILMVGEIQNNSYFTRTNSPLEANKVFGRSWGFISTAPLIWHNNTLSWKKFFYEYMGSNAIVLTESTQEDILQTKEYQEMEAYPSTNSIKIINDVLVVKLH